MVTVSYLAMISTVLVSSGDGGAIMAPADGLRWFVGGPAVELRWLFPLELSGNCVAWHCVAEDESLLFK